MEIGFSRLAKSDFLALERNDVPLEAERPLDLLHPLH